MRGRKWNIRRAALALATLVATVLAAGAHYRLR